MYIIHSTASLFTSGFPCEKLDCGFLFLSVIFYAAFIKCFLFYLSLTSAKCPSARSFLDFFLT